ncbi:MAG: hypothetical protein JJ992_06665, partial [Planctomycetes bacterium]|nr:hypothetical protein [Planctomycetota bacterium]
MLFAQSPSGYSVDSGLFLASLIVAGGILAFVALFFGLLYRHLRINRELTHQERLRAIEMGKPLDDD